MALEIREGMEAATVIRQMAELAAQISKEKGVKIISGTIGQPIGNTDPHVIDMAVLSTLSYRGKKDDGVFTAEEATKIFEFIQQLKPELFSDASMLKKFGINLDGEAKNIQYTPGPGRPELRKLVAESLKNDYYPELADQITEGNVFFTLGGTTGLTACFGALKGDFFIPQGYFALYDNQAKSFEKNINVIPQEADDFNLKAKAIDDYLEDFCQKKRVAPEDLKGNFLYCYPGNPITTIPSQEELEKLGALFRDKYKNLNIIIDAPYENFKFKLKDFDPEKFAKGEMKQEDWAALVSESKTLLQRNPDLFGRSFTSMSIGKDISATGLRIGIAIVGGGPAEQAALAGTHFNLAHNPPANLQPLIPYALSYGHTLEHKAELAEKYIPRLHALNKTLNDEGILVGGEGASGGMFANADLSNLIGLQIKEEENIKAIKSVSPNFKGLVRNGFDIVPCIMNTYFISGVPGEAFALPSGMVRISLSQDSLEETKEMGKRLVQASRDAAVEHIMAAMLNTNGVQIKDNMMMCAKANFDPEKIDRLKQLKGLTVDDSGDRSIKIDFKSAEFKEIFEKSFNAARALSK